MGVGYTAPITQWSQGEYPDANNTQDDFAVMQTNGLPTRADDHVGGVGAGTPLTSVGGSLVGSGVIETLQDIDNFSFTQSCTGNTSIVATPAPTSPNLDIKLDVSDGGGNPIQTVNPASAMVSEDVASGLGASTVIALAPGTYNVTIDGTAAGSPATTGYSGYGSLGSFNVSVGTCTAGGTSIAGVVRDASGNPVKGARVTTSPATTTVISAANGSYSLGTVPAGTYSVKAEHLCAGAKTQSVTVNGAETADFALSLTKCQLVNEAWVDGTTVLGLNGDDAAQTVNLPFTYRHMGTDHTQAHISTNGFVSFVGQSTSFDNGAIPGTAAPNGAIYAFWDDLIDDASSNIRTRTIGTAPNRRFVIEWNNLQIIDTTRRLSFEVILSENRSQKPVILYKGVEAGTAETGTSATVGIENANGTKATQLNLNGGLVYDGVAVAPIAPK